MRCSSAVTSVSAEARRSILAGLGRATEREVRELASRPHLLWQQLHNRVQWLEEARPVLRHREGERIRTGRETPWLRTRTPFRESDRLLRVLESVPHAVPDVAEGHARMTIARFSPDGSRILAAGGDQTLRVWDAKSGIELQVFSGHSGVVTSCAFSADGSQVVSAATDGAIIIWDAASGDELDRLNGHDRPIDGCAVSPDGALMVSTSLGTSLAWRRTGEWRSERLAGGSRPRGMCEFSPDGSWLAFVDGGVLALSDPGFWERHTLGGARVEAFAFSPDGTLVVAADEKTLTVFDVPGGDEVRTIGAPTYLRACAFSPDGTRILSSGVDRIVRIWDAQSGAALGVLEGHGGWIDGCAFSPDGTRIVTASDDGTVRLWDAEGDFEERPLVGHERDIAGCTFNPDGSRVASAGRDRELKIWNVGTSEVLDSLSHEHEVVACDFHPDGVRIVAAAGGTLKLWDATSGDDLRTFVDEPGAIETCVFHPDGSLIAAGGRLWALDEWAPLAQLGTGSPEATVFGRDGTTVVAATLRAIERIDLRTGVAVQSIEVHDWVTQWECVTDCAVSPDDRRFVTADGDGTLRVWDADAGIELRPLEGHGDPVTACAFSPDGSWIVSTSSRSVPASGDRTLRLWSADTGEGVARLRLLAGGSSVALHPWRPLAACGDRAGGFYLVDLVGIEYGPIVVTAIAHGRRQLLRCPRCGESHALDRAWLGTVIDCPNVGCDLLLRVNPFVASNPLRAKRHRPWRR
jgi:WD40 repeat protein